MDSVAILEQALVWTVLPSCSRLQCGQCCHLVAGLSVDSVAILEQALVWTVLPSCSRL